MWYDAEQKGYLDIIYDFKKYIVNKVDDLDNVSFFDFQDYEGIIDLNNYKDTTHYKPELNDMMINHIYNNKCVVNSSNIDERLKNLDELIEKFKHNNKDWL